VSFDVSEPFTGVEGLDAEADLSEAATPDARPVGAGALGDDGSESLSGTSFSRLRADCCGSSFFGSGLGSSFFGAGLGSSGFLTSSFFGSGLGSSFLAAAAGAGEEAVLVLVGVAVMGVLFADVALVSRSTRLGRAVFPPNQSAAERAGSIELAGG
jgi:hypothetical protein